MSFPFRKFLFIFLLLAATGGETALLQCVAWGSMLAGNLRTVSVSQAVRQTFDGNHPCPLCMAIARAKKSAKKTDSISQSTRLEFPPVFGSCFRLFPIDFSRVSISGEFAQTLGRAPLTPPPRG
jgi:hypothetical protein